MDRRKRRKIKEIENEFGMEFEEVLKDFATEYSYTFTIKALGLNKDESVKLEWQAKSEDGTIFVSTAEELEAGVDISVLTEDGTTIPLPVGLYVMEDGTKVKVEEENDGNRPTRF